MIGTINKASLSLSRPLMQSRRVSNLLFVLELVLVFFLFVQQVEAVYNHVCPTYETICADKRGGEPLHQNKRKLVLSINAANSIIDWESINSLTHNEWEVQELVLDNFGDIMRDNSFTAALENSFDTLKATIQDLKPDILLVASKGVGIIAYLASKNIWVKRPIILFSPIPNPIDGLVSGDSYESEWTDTIDILKNSHLSPVMLVTGSSSDEEVFISKALQEPSACGNISRKTGTFEKCKDWRLLIVPGDHFWKNVPENEHVIAKVIDYSFRWLTLNIRKNEGTVTKRID